MTMLHAWFSAQTALRDGSSVYRKAAGSTVNVTRMDADRASKGAAQYGDEIYVGEVVSKEDGGCEQEMMRVRSIHG